MDSKLIKEIDKDEIVEEEIPLSEQNLFTSDTVQMIKDAKEKNQTAFQSYWEYDENDIDNWTDKEIEADADKKFVTLAENGKLSEIKILVQSQTKDDDVANLLRFKDSDGYTALHRASYSNNIEVVKYLLSLEDKLHVKVNQLEAVTDMGWTPLHSACYWNSYKVVEYLIKYFNADCNLKSNGGQTCLHLVAQQSIPKESLLLLLTNPFTKFGIKNSQNETAYDIAIRSSKFNSLFEITQDHLNKL